MMEIMELVEVMMMVREIKGLVGVREVMRG